jgi:hypothetical protein
MLAATHACASTAGAMFADTLGSIEASRFRKMVEDAMPPKAERLMSTCGMRWPVTPTDNVRACGDGHRCGA